MELREACTRRVVFYRFPSIPVSRSTDRCKTATTEIVNAFRSLRA